MPKQLFDVEIIDSVGHRPSWRRDIIGKSMIDANRKAAKLLPPSINLREIRDPKSPLSSRFVFLTSKKR